MRLSRLAAASVLAIGAVVTLGAGVVVTASAAGAPPLRDPSSLLVAGSDLWVANAGDGSLVELNATTGHRVRVVSGSSFHFNRYVPDHWAMARSGSSLWVANQTANSVTELNEWGCCRNG